MTYQPFVFFLCIAKLDIRGGRPQERGGDAQDGAGEEGKHGGAGCCGPVCAVVVVPQGAHVQGVAEGADDEARLGAQDVEHGPAKEADEDEEPVEQGVGLVGDGGRGRVAAAGAETGQGDVYPREAEEDTFILRIRLISPLLSHAKRGRGSGSKTANCFHRRRDEEVMGFGWIAGQGRPGKGSIAACLWRGGGGSMNRPSDDKVLGKRPMEMDAAGEDAHGCDVTASSYPVVLLTAKGTAGIVNQEKAPGPSNTARRQL